MDKRLGVGGEKEETSTATSTTSSTTTEADRLSERIKSEAAAVSQKRNQSASPPDLQGTFKIEGLDVRLQKHTTS